MKEVQLIGISVTQLAMRSICMNFKLMYFIRKKDFIYLQALKNSQQFYFNLKQRHKAMNKLV